MPGKPVDTPKRAIFDLWPQLRARVPWVRLGDLPTPVQRLTPVIEALGASTEAWIKRDDLTSPLYGGNKVRTLEVLLARALDQGSTHIYATGAFGSNHAVATVLHAKTLGLEPGVLLFPQPPSRAALENLLASLSTHPDLWALWHWSALPFGMSACKRRCRRQNTRATIMVPGGATPYGALGYVSAGLELAQQVEDGLLPAPEAIVVGVGSTCTSAGLLVGLHHAAKRGIGFETPPKIISVRVTPWPVTSPIRIARLAAATSQGLARLAADPSLEVPYKVLRGSLEVDGRFLGKGYGKTTDTGLEAIDLFGHMPGLTLDTTYSGKAAAAVVHRMKSGRRGPVVFWSTKSTAPLPAADAETIASAPRVIRWWIDTARRTLGEKNT